VLESHFDNICKFEGFPSIKSMLNHTKFEGSQKFIFILNTKK
jgi:hypothetical protein